MIVFVVHDYDHVAYAGPSFGAAARKLKGGNKVQVWIDGRRAYDEDLDYNDGERADELKTLHGQ